MLGPGRAKPEAVLYHEVRRHQRVPWSVPITVYRLMSTGVHGVHGISLDISEGGMGALVESQLRVGEAVEIEMPLTERALAMAAIVRHTSPVCSGFEFLGLTAEERLKIVNAIAR